MKKFREEIENVMDDAFTLGANNAPVASAYFLEAIARMMYVDMFHSKFERDYERDLTDKITVDSQDEISESTDI